LARRFHTWDEIEVAPGTTEGGLKDTQFVAKFKKLAMCRNLRKGRGKGVDFEVAEK
jgi:hypothetical protein